MNFSEVKEIVKHLKKMVPCTTCGKKFPDQDIQVLSTFCAEALFHFDCSYCKNQLVVHVSVIEQDEKTSRLSIQARGMSSVGPNDVLDIHNFLTRFNGDFKTLFSTKSS